MIRLLIVGLIVLFASSCVTQRRCLEKFGSDTTYVTIRDTIPVTVEVPLPGDSITGSIGVDSVRLFLEGQIDSLFDVSQSGKLRAKFWFDKYNQRVKYYAKQRPDTVEKKIEVPVAVVAPCPPVVRDTAMPTWYEKVWKHFQFFSAMLVLAGLALLILKRFI